MNDQDTEIFTSLWTEAQPAVSRYILSLVRDPSDSRDVLQQTALTLVRKFSGYDRDEPFLPWALSIAKFQVLGHRRDSARNRVTFDSDLLDRYTETWADLSPSHSDESAALQVCLTKLPDRSRKLVRLRYFEGMNSREIARESSLPSGSVRVSLQRIREQLRQCVERQIRTNESPA